MSITNNHVETATFLIEKGSDINVVDWYGRTPLWSAVEVRNMDVDNSQFTNGVDRGPVLAFIKVLLDKGADPNTRLKEVPRFADSFCPLQVRWSGWTLRE
jgi:ankyrin repeat protein